MGLVVQEVQKFLGEHYKRGKPLLVGFSGGPDSLALLHALLAWQRAYDLEIHLAHVDHGWREESSKEAELLREMALARGLTFHLETLDCKDVKGNLELFAREKRYAFFSKIYNEIKPQALLLGHHADDQAETVLKRLLEGSSLFSLGGVKKVSTFEEMVVWRPFLPLLKKEILEWLGKKGLTPIEDYTNHDPRYLRARMRVEMLPKMREMFGKDISYNLYYLGEGAQKLKEYFDRKTDIYMKAIKEGSCGKALDLNPFFPIEELELDALIKRICLKEDIFLSREDIFLIKELLQKNSSKKTVGNVFIIDKRSIYF